MLVALASAGASRLFCRENVACVQFSCSMATDKDTLSGGMRTRARETRKRHFQHRGNESKFDFVLVITLNFYAGKRGLSDPTQRNPQAMACDASRLDGIISVWFIMRRLWCRGERLCSVWQISTTSSFCRKNTLFGRRKCRTFFFWVAFADVVPSVVEQKSDFSVILLKAIFDSVQDLDALIAWRCPTQADSGTESARWDRVSWSTACLKLMLETHYRKRSRIKYRRTLLLPCGCAHTHTLDTTTRPPHCTARATVDGVSAKRIFNSNMDFICELSQNAWGGTHT